MKYNDNIRLIVKTDDSHEVVNLIDNRRDANGQILTRAHLGKLGESLPFSITLNPEELYIKTGSHVPINELEAHGEPLDLGKTSESYRVMGDYAFNSPSVENRIIDTIQVAHKKAVEIAKENDCDALELIVDLSKGRNGNDHFYPTSDVPRMLIKYKLDISAQLYSAK